MENLGIILFIVMVIAIIVASSCKSNVVFFISLALIAICVLIGLITFILFIKDNQGEIINYVKTLLN